jgi:hypothetical protein
MRLATDRPYNEVVPSIGAMIHNERTGRSHDTLAKADLLVNVDYSKAVRTVFSSA